MQDTRESYNRRSLLGEIALTLGIVALMLWAVACAPKTYHIATVSAISAHTTLALIQDSEKLAVCGLPTAPAPPACVPQDKHVEISKRLETAFDYDGRLLQAVRSTPANQPLPADALQWVGLIQGEVTRIIGLIPPGSFKDAITSKIGGGGGQ